MSDIEDVGGGCMLILVVVCVILGIVYGAGDKSDSSSSTKRTPINTYQAPKPTYTPPPSYNYTPIQPVPRQQVVTREATPDDAYSEGYDEGYEQGKNDGRNGHSHGYGYDDSSDYYDYYETRYQEGYEEGYEEGYQEGQSDYEEALEEENSDD